MIKININIPYLIKIQYLNVDLKLLMARFEMNITVFGKVFMELLTNIKKNSFSF